MLKLADAIFISLSHIGTHAKKKKKKIFSQQPAFAPKSGLWKAPARYEIMMAQYVCWSSAGAYVESDGQARSPVRPQGSTGCLEPANDKPPTYWLSAHGRPSPSCRSTQAAPVTSAPRLNPYWPGTAADGRPSEPIVWGCLHPGRAGWGGAVAELGRVTLPAALCIAL